MKKIILFLSAIALFVACDKEESSGPEPNTFCVSKDGADDVYISDVSLTYYEGDDVIVVHNFAYASGMPVCENLPITGGDFTANGGDIVVSNTDALYATYEVSTIGTTSEISSLGGTIYSNNQASLAFVISAAMMSSGSTTDYTCVYSGSIKVESGSYEGMYVTATGGTPSLLSNITVTYYEGDNTLVIDRFAYSEVMQDSRSETLVIPDVYLVDGISNYFSISGDEITPTSSTLVAGTIDNLSGCVINETKAEFSFSTYVVSGYGSNTYTCSYVGDITVSAESYSLL